MRVIAGKFRGRKLKSPSGLKTRPTADRVREALFSILGGIVPGSRVLDLFAGTGALGLEALSRGAERAVFVENHVPAAAVIRENIATLGLRERSEVIVADYRDALRRLGERGESCDLVLADPPYQDTGKDGPYRGEIILSLIEASATLRKNGLVVIQHPHQGESAASPPRWRWVQSKKYGRTGLTIYEIQQ